VAGLSSQTPTPPPSAPSFEVASIKPNVSGETRTYYNRGPGIR
jgi:hypothetical protein